MILEMKSKCFLTDGRTTNGQHLIEKLTWTFYLGKLKWVRMCSSLINVFFCFIMIQFTVISISIHFRQILMNKIELHNNPNLITQNVRKLHHKCGFLIFWLNTCLLFIKFLKCYFVCHITRVAAYSRIKNKHV